MSDMDSNQFRSATAPQLMSWSDFTTLLNQMERTYPYFTLVVRKKESGDVVVSAKRLPNLSAVHGERRRRQRGPARARR